MPVVASLPPALPRLGCGSSYSENSITYPSPHPGNYYIPSPTMQNGSVASNENFSISEIKEKAKEDARRSAKGVSAISLLRAARSQLQSAQSYEDTGDLKNALSALLKAGSLAAMVMNSNEFTNESRPGKHGVLYRECVDFQKTDGNNLKQRVEAIESRLTDLEKSASSDPVSGTTTRMPGTSIADRVKSLNDAGLAVGTTKRPPREVPDTPSSTTQKLPETGPIHRPSTSIPSHPQPFQLPNYALVASSSSAGSSPHAVVPPWSLGPPSPVSSDSSSPRQSHTSISEFTQAFPEIEQFNELNLSLLSANSRTFEGSSAETDLPVAHVDDVESSLPPHLKSFPPLSIDLGQRPSSTPVTPTVNAFMSRPTSPVFMSKPSINNFASASPQKRSPLTEKRALPISNAVTPGQLFDRLRKFKVLLVDIRAREEFETEHISNSAILCLEPSVLTRVNVSVEAIENSLAVAPPEELVLFQNRDKFELVVLYDASSEAYDAGGPLSTFVRLVFENALRKVLRSPPMLLIGGLQAWKREYGDSEVTRGSSSARRTPTRIVENRLNSIPMPLQTSATPAPTRLQLLQKQPLTNGVSSSDRVSLELHPPPQSSDSSVGTQVLPEGPVSIIRKSPMLRPPSTASHNHSPSEPSSFRSVAMPPSPAINVNTSAAPISYPSFPSFSSPTPPFTAVSIPPQASINPSRRRSDYMDGPQSPITGLSSRPVIDYPDLPLPTLRPPPPVASHSSERQDARPRFVHASSYSLSTLPHATEPKPPVIASYYPVNYWPDAQITTTGLKNLGNTCYMNATIQCLRATVPFARFFTDGRWKSAVNMRNRLGTEGRLAQAFASILYEMSHSELPYVNPLNFRRYICYHAPQFGGSDQHDSQEFLTFLLDGLHEDINRILIKPANNHSTPEREAELEKLPQQVASEQEWTIYKMRNDSLVVDYFQGQFRNRMECLTCHHTSTTYNSFMYLSLPIPASKSGTRVSLSSCLDAFVSEEVLEKADAWHCPKCKQLRKATKKLTLSRLPPVLLIHLKRFSVKGPFTDKIETVVDFPVRALDLTNYMPAPLPPGMVGSVNGVAPSSADDAQVQLPPYKYDLYGVTNHFGSLSNGHYTAFIASRGAWLYCDDSRITPTDAKEVVGRPAYVLFYKRVRD
ncbi:hypothetical protein EDD17DRAFT_1561941 [Pisolithus thermaeus]|nr:hypothetical protein EDD17DRAFT_1561941 [Pisolithus thermaeus]